MKISDLRKACKVVSAVSNSTSISNLFRCVELSSRFLRACSEHGNIEYTIGFPEISSPKLINTLAFFAVVNSLPDEGELELTETPEKLSWKCGAASGFWSYVWAEQVVPFIQHPNCPWSPPKDFPEALILSAASCQSMTVSLGLYGVVIEPLEGKLRLMSSNAVSLAEAKVSLDGYPITTQIVLRPPIPKIFSSLLTSGVDPKVDIDASGIYVLTDKFSAHLPLSAPLEHNIGEILTRFTNANDTAKISSVAIHKFLNRAKALSDKGVSPTVTLSILNGNIVLTQQSVAASAEEYFLASGLSADKSFASVVLTLSLILEALLHIDIAVLDYLDQNVLILRGSNPEFCQIVGGKAK